MKVSMQKEIKKQPIMLYTEQTPNPETLKFVTNQMIYPRKTAEFKQDDLAFLPVRAEPLPIVLATDGFWLHHFA